jgi:hypothetical protein
VFIVDVSLKNNRHENAFLILCLNDRLNMNAPMSFGGLDRVKAYGLAVSDSWRCILSYLSDLQADSLRDRKSSGQNENIEVKFGLPLLRPERHMIGFESDEAILQRLRERLRSMTDEELIEFVKAVRGLSAGPSGTSNSFKRQLDEARAEWKRGKRFLA